MGETLSHSTENSTEKSSAVEKIISGATGQ